MRWLLFTLLIGCITGCENKSEVNWNFFSADSKAIVYVGRFETETNYLPKVWAPGAYCSFSFQGKNCDILIFDEVKYGTSHNYIEICIDDFPPRRMQLKEAKNVIPVAKNLKDKIHHVRITKNTESGIGYIQFAGIWCKKLIKSKRKKTTIEFIGDSITCGNGSDTTEIGCKEGNWYDQHNAYESYGPIVARKLNAEWMLSSVSGIGLTRSCCSIKHTMPDVYGKTNFQMDGNEWSQGNEPTILCITLGQNDGLQQPKKYIGTYIGFIQQLRKRYPTAHIVCCSSPMADKKLQLYHSKYIPKIVKLLQIAGEQHISYFLYKGNYRSGCFFHPTLSQHQEIASELFPHIDSLLNK